MMTIEVVRRLKQLNPRIYMVNTGVTSDGVRLVGIRLDKQRETRVGSAVFDKRSRDLAAGNIDIHLGSMVYPDVPEFGLLDPTGERMNMPGWRAFLLKCVDKGAITLDGARRKFSRSLGEHDFDKLDFYAKERRLKGL